MSEAVIENLRSELRDYKEYALWTDEGAYVGDLLRSAYGSIRHSEGTDELRSELEEVIGQYHDAGFFVVDDDDELAELVARTIAALERERENV
jgi:hypothetical protein